MKIFTAILFLVLALHAINIMDMNGGDRTRTEQEQHTSAASHCRGLHRCAASERADLFPEIYQVKQTSRQ